MLFKDCLDFRLPKFLQAGSNLAAEQLRHNLFFQKKKCNTLGCLGPMVWEEIETIPTILNPDPVKNYVRTRQLIMKTSVLFNGKSNRSCICTFHFCIPSTHWKTSPQKFWETHQKITVLFNLINCYYFIITIYYKLKK
jgi:hypothetical protein